jgi:hypothetical protein
VIRLYSNLIFLASFRDGLTIRDFHTGPLKWAGNHPKTLNAVLITVNVATVVSGFFDFGASDALVPEELAGEELIEAEAKAAVKEAVEETTANANKLAHIFDNPGHNLGDLLSKFGGSQEQAYNAVQNATQAAVRQQGLTGVFQTTVNVAGETITVRGTVVNGVVKMGTFFK